MSFSKPIILCLVTSLCFSCESELNGKAVLKMANELGEDSSYYVAYIDSSENTIEKRFICPPGFERLEGDSSSFAHYLRTMILFPIDHEVRYFDGRLKSGYGIYCSVVDLPIGDRDRHQCADAVMNVRAHYLYSIGKYDDIHFNFSNGFMASYSEWRKGKRIKISNDKVSWYATEKESKSYSSFLEYLQKVYSYAGTYSLDKELNEVDTKDIQPGDVFIKGGFPGHAVIVLDVVENLESGERKFLLGQSYMPAQELQILVNNENEDGSPWYSNLNLEKLYTPQWTFDEGSLKRF